MPQQYRALHGCTARWQAELAELEGTITYVEDLLRSEMTRSIVEVVEAEVK